MPEWIEDWWSEMPSRRYCWMALGASMLALRLIYLATDAYARKLYGRGCIDDGYAEAQSYLVCTLLLIAPFCRLVFFRRLPLPGMLARCALLAAAIAVWVVGSWVVSLLQFFRFPVLIPPPL